MAQTSPLLDLCPEELAWEGEAALFIGDILCIQLDLFGL